MASWATLSEAVVFPLRLSPPPGPPPPTPGVGHKCDGLLFGHFPCLCMRSEEAPPGSEVCLGWCLTLGLLGLLFPGALNCRSSGMAGLQGPCRDTGVSRLFCLMPQARGAFASRAGHSTPFWQLRGTSPVLPHPSRPRASSLCWATGAGTFSLGCVLQFRPVASHKPGAGTSYPCALAAEGDPPALRHLPSWASACPSVQWVLELQGRHVGGMVLI